MPSDADNDIDTRLSTAITAFDPSQPATGAAVTNGVAEARNAALITTNHWPKDVFSEKGSDRYDLHRVQLAAFSFFYAAVFLWGLNSILALPEFSATTLALLGISSGSYLGYKFASTETR